MLAALRWICPALSRSRAAGWSEQTALIWIRSALLWIWQSAPFLAASSQDASLRTGPVNMPRSPPSGVFDGTVAVSDSAAVGYRLFLHPEAEAEPSRIPLLVYFHGNGEVARDCERSFSRTRAPLLGPSR